MKKKIVHFQKVWPKQKNNRIFRFSDADLIPESSGFYYDEMTDNKELLRSILQNGALNLLSDQENKVFNLVFKKGFSLKSTGKLLRLSKWTVRNYVDKIAEKLKHVIALENDYQNRFIND